MNQKKIWLSPPHMSGLEQKYIQEAFDSNWVAPVGFNIDAFEKQLEHYLENKDISVVALNTGTSALHLALILAGVKNDDIVLCQSFTFSASVNPIVYQGAKPVFIDSETNTWNLCPILLEKSIKNQISKGKKPRALIVVHLYGMPAKVDEIIAIAKKYEITVIEDAAEAIGSIYKGQKCGSFGDFGILSFNGNKIITTSSGGALICNNKETSRKALFLAKQAQDKAPHYEHSEIGYNYRMSNVLAGIGRGQLEVLDKRVIARRLNFERYKQEFADISEIKFLAEPPNFYSNRWLTCILLPSFEIREKIRIGLEREQIESRPLWKPMHQQPVFKSYTAYLNGVSDELFERGLCLPSGSDLSEQDLKRVTKLIKELL